MAKQEVDIGVEGNDGTGDSIRESFRKVNENFTELYAVFGQEGSLSFLSLGDTPEAFADNKIVTTNATGDAIIFSSITSTDGTIGVDLISNPGNIDLTVTAIEIVQDTVAPTLGGHLSGEGIFAIGGVAISEAAAAALSNQPGRAEIYTIDDLVITKGYADRRYITSGLPIRVAEEPASAEGFTKTIDFYNGDGHLVFSSGHGFDSGVNGTPYIFNAEDTDPTNLTTGTTYYIRYESDTELSVFLDRVYAEAESDSFAEPFKVVVSGAIAADDTHTITDAAYDDSLEGNFLSDVAMPRKSVVRRTGDTMTGTLTLSDHPGDLAGSGTPNGQSDLQAATKFYVDNTAYSSPEVLFVSTAGDDTMQGVPFGKEGTANTYAFRSVNAAARRAAEIIETAPEEPGPYFQTLSYGATPITAGTAAQVTAGGVESAVNTGTRNILGNNRKFLQKEVIGYIAFTYPDFAYNVELCERDLGLIVDAVGFDATRGDTANFLSRQAARRYYSSVSGRIAITSQLERTDDSFAKLGEFIQAALTNSLFNPKTVTAITKKSGDNPAVVTTSTAHNLSDGNQIIFKTVSGMTQIIDEIIYVKKITDTTVELFTDSTLSTPYDNSSYTTFVNDGSAQIGVRYQSKFDQDTSISALSPTDNGYIAVTQNINLIRNIIKNGINAGADIAYGNRYQLITDNSSAGELDQTNPDNVDALPGKVIRGKRSGAIGRIITYTQNTGGTTFFLQPLEAKDFEAGEELELGNYVNAKQVVIRVEAGIYEEDYPIKLSRNVSLKGDEFRRVIIRPKRRVSQSTWADTYFYRDKEFDGNTLLTTGTPFINQVGQTQGYFGRHYLLDNTKALNVGNAINNLGKYNKAAEVLKLNREFIQAEVGEYADATYPTLFSIVSRAKCERDVGLIVDALVNDLQRGGEEATLEAQGEYYAGALTPGTEAETADSIAQISSIAADLLAGVDPAGSGFNRGSVDVDLTQGIVEPAWSAGTDYAQGDFVKTTRGVTNFYYRALVSHTAEASDQDVGGGNDQELTNTNRWIAVTSSTEQVGDLVDKVNFAFDSNYNPPKRNDDDGVDVFMMDDATIVRNVTVQGHGGFMCVLDPVGQVLTKSPYIQTATSFSRSRNAKAFTGGMFVDAFCGNIPMRVLGNSGNSSTFGITGSNVTLDAFTLVVESLDVGGEPQGLKLRLPQLPAPFYFDGIRYQVNAISNYDSGTGKAVLYLDPSSGNDLGWNKAGADNVGDPGHDVNDIIQDIFLQTAGNRSILGNDFTQINDLGYGLVTTNGAFSEMVSMFTYYTHAAYYAANGSEIRSLNGSNGYGNFGLVAEGADPNEIPDEVTTLKNMVQPIKAFTYSGFTNASGDTTITVYDFKEAPMSNSYIYIDHGGAVGPLNYRISRVENLADPNGGGIGGFGKGGAVIATGVESVNNASITGTIPSVTSTFLNVKQKSTSGSGVGAEFTIAVTAGTPNTALFTVTDVGYGYTAGDTITIDGADIGGVSSTNDLTIPVTLAYGTTQGTYVAAQKSGSISAITQANPVVVTSTGHTLTNGEKVYFSGISGMNNLNTESYWVGNVTANTFELYTNASLTVPLNGLTFGAYTSGGTFETSGGIGNHVYRLSLQEAGSNIDYYGELQDTVTNNTLIEYRHGENFIFTGVADSEGITERPSTAVNFDESDLATYRSTGFTRSDDQNQSLGSDEIRATFDATFGFEELTVKFAKLTTTDPDNGAKTLGSLVGDTKIAIEAINDADIETRLVTDATDATSQTLLQPGDPGYTGGMIFTHQGKTFQIIDYQPVDYGTITGATQADPVVVSSTGHGLSNGDGITIRNVGGMTNLNGNTFYVGNVTANTFELYSDSAITNTIDGTGYNAYTSGGQWVDDESAWYIEVQDYQADGADWDITGSAANTGIKTAFTKEQSLFAGLQIGTTAEITISISLCRATGHDFTQIGTGGFNTSNYPNVLLGRPTEDKAPAYSDEDNASKAQVWERRKGRVFFISSDENGFFRVGKYFVVDQATGSITFSGEVGISRAASLGFKDGVVISEFSNDELFTDLSDTAVPTEKAIANYVSRRLGHNGSIQLTGSSRFDPGFMALDGSTKMEANMNMNSNKITNLLDPTDDNDAATKDYVVQATTSYDEIDDLRNVLIHDRNGTGLEQKQLFVPTGYKRLVVDPLIGTIADGDTLNDGSSTATVIATETRFDYVENKNVQIITYDLLTGAGFNTTLTPVYVGPGGSPTATATVLENPIDEFANASEKTTSDINITISRSSSAPYTEVDLQIEAQAILNSDVNDDAEISQAKLLMNRAKPLSSSTGLYGTDGDAGSIGEGDPDGTGRTGQSSRGLAAFEYDSFAEDVQLTVTTANITADAGDILYQGDPSTGTKPTGYVVNSVINQPIVIIRTSDVWVDDETTPIYKSTVTNGVAGTATNISSTVFSGGYLRSGYINLKDRGVAFEKLPNLTGGNLGDDYGGSAIGRATDGNGAAEEVSFATIIDQGRGLADSDFGTERAYYSNPPTNTIVNDPGDVLIQYGTPGDGNYAYTNIAYDNSNNSIAKRDINGKIQATGYIIGGVSTQEILSESSGTLSFKTPAQGTILTASGATKPTLNTGGAIRVGDIAAYSESNLHAASDFGTSGGSTETSALAARWIYSSFIEAPDEKDATGTGVGIGAGIGKTLATADTITFITGGNVEARVTTTGVETDDIRSISTNTNLTLSGNGTGIVYVNDNLDVNGTFSATSLEADNISSESSNTDLTLSGKGTGVVYVSDTLKTTSITTGAAATAGTITGNWTLTTGSKFEATYADLAEYYEADVEYEVGTVVIFGGEKEITSSKEHRSTRVAGVVSENPAYVMNAECPGIATAIALQGRVPVKVIGKVRKGDMLVASAIPGYAMVDAEPKVGSVIGKAVGEKLDGDKGIVEVVVGRL